MRLEPLPGPTGASADVDGLLCVDTEDAYQIVLRNFGGGPRYCRAQFRRGLSSLLEILNRHRCRATFFVLGMTAAEDPGVVGELIDAGHEVATHGYHHVHLERVSTEQFRQDLRRAVDELSDLTGSPVLGHRAPEFSIPRADPAGFFRVLVECGLRYDSSVFPFAGPRYGLPAFPRVPCRVHLAQGSLIELPLATVRWAGRNWPIAGGGYWRLMPRRLLRRAMGRARRQGVLLTLYLHNYEFDPKRFDLAAAVDTSELSPGWRQVQRKQNLFLRTISGKLEDLLARLRFTCCRDYVADFLRIPADNREDELGARRTD